MSIIRVEPKLVLVPMLIIVVLNSVGLPRIVYSQDVQAEDHDDLIETQLPPRQVPSPQQWLAHHFQQSRFSGPMQMNGMNKNNARRKKDCFPVLTRRLFGAVLKRSHPHLANSEEEVDEKIKEEDNGLAVRGLCRKTKLD